MFRSLSLLAIIVVGSSSWLGCVSVDTPDTKVNVGITSVNLPERSSSKPDSAPYARPLRKVGEQQAKVAKYIARQDWEEVVDEASEWTDQIRELRGYAHTSHDMGLFREYCDTLLIHVQTLRQAAMRRDGLQAQQAFDACDPPLNRLTRAFPPQGVTTRRDANPGTNNQKQAGSESGIQPATRNHTQQVP